jgi:hypothetical protein
MVSGNIVGERASDTAIALEQQRGLCLAASAYPAAARWHQRPARRRLLTGGVTVS